MSLSVFPDRRSRDHEEEGRKHARHLARAHLESLNATNEIAEPRDVDDDDDEKHSGMLGGGGVGDLLTRC